jgi:hypothetical protein
MNYRDAAQLCQWIHGSVTGIPMDIRPSAQSELADAFAELSKDGWVKDQESWYRAFYGAHFHSVIDRGHWIEVIASSIKAPETFDFDSARKIAREVGLRKDPHIDEGPH